MAYTTSLFPWIAYPWRDEPLFSPVDADGSAFAAYRPIPPVPVLPATPIAMASAERVIFLRREIAWGKAREYIYVATEDEPRIQRALAWFSAASKLFDYIHKAETSK